MARPVTLFTGQWADLPFEEVARLAGRVGLRRPRDRLLGRPPRRLARRRATTPTSPAGSTSSSSYGLKVLGDLEPPQRARRSATTRSTSATSDILPDRMLGRRRPGGRPAARRGGAEGHGAAGREARRRHRRRLHRLDHLEVPWRCSRRVADEVIEAGYRDFADRWNPILDVFDEVGVRFAHEVHPSEIAYDYWTTVRTLEAIGHREAFGLNWDPSAT